MKKIYISGGITNVPDYRERFADAERRLKAMGFEVVNPVTVGDLLDFGSNCSEEEKYQLYMKADLKALLDCDAIFMLKGWAKSKGARFEHHSAEMCGLVIAFEEAEDLFNALGRTLNPNSLDEEN